MSRSGGGRCAWLFNRQVAWALLYLALVVGAAVAINLIGIRLLGDIEAWRHWMQEHAGSFRAWRLFLYAAIAYGWWWMRRRVLQRDPSPEARRCLVRTEVLAVAAFALLEINRVVSTP